MGAAIQPARWMNLCLRQDRKFIEIWSTLQKKFPCFEPQSKQALNLKLLVEYAPVKSSAEFINEEEPIAESKTNLKLPDF